MTDFIQKITKVNRLPKKTRQSTLNAGFPSCEEFNELVKRLNSISDNDESLTADSFVYTPGSQAAGSILTSDANGLATWTSALAASAIALANTVFVAKNGVDATGVIGRLDKPFLTLAAARTAAVAAVPSATNRILIKVFSGTYLEGIVLANFVDWDLGNAVIDLQAGSLATIDDNGVACESVIYGKATIKRTTAGTQGCVRTSHASTVLSVFCDSLSSSIGVTILCTTGTQYVEARKTYSLQTVTCTAGIQTVRVINNNVSSIGIGTCITNGGTQTIYANVYPAAAVTCTSGIQKIYGNVLEVGVVCSGGAQTIYGDVSSSGGADVAACSGGTQTIYGTVAQLSNVGPASFCLTCTGTGTQVHTGSLISINITAGSGLINHASTSVTSVYTSTTVASACVTVVGLQISTGTVRLKNSYINVTGTNSTPVYKSGGTLIIENSTLVSTAGGYCISSPSPQSVKIYGTCQANLAKNSAFLITEQVNSIVIDANVA